MCFSKLRQTVIGLIDDHDPYIDSKRLQLDQWCSAFLYDFCASDISSFKSGKLNKFYQDVLLDEECWEESDTPHGVKFNRRVAARKMVGPRISEDTHTDLFILERYYIACLCCLEENIILLFDKLQQMHFELHGCNPVVVAILLNMARKKIKKVDHMLEFWSYYEIGAIQELNLKGKNFYACGLEKVLSGWNVRVEGVEYFWDKIKSDNSLNDCEKGEIFVNAAISALASGIQCDVFEFCFSQLSPDKYRELLRRDFEMNKHHESFERLQLAFRFDLCRKIFDCLKPGEISEKRYCFWLSFMRLAQCPDYYLDGAVELVTHMWLKVGFDRHRDSALRDELSEGSSRQGDLLLPLVKRNYMQAVWTILGGIRDEVSRELFKEFLNSRRGNIIVNTLKDDQGSLTTFLSYKYERKRRSSRLENTYKRVASGE